MSGQRRNPWRDSRMRATIDSMDEADEPKRYSWRTLIYGCVIVGCFSLVVSSVILVNVREPTFNLRSVDSEPPPTTAEVPPATQETTPQTTVAPTTTTAPPAPPVEAIAEPTSTTTSTTVTPAEVEGTRLHGGDFEVIISPTTTRPCDINPEHPSCP